MGIGRRGTPEPRRERGPEPDQGPGGDGSTAEDPGRGAARTAVIRGVLGGPDGDAGRAASGGMAAGPHAAQEGTGGPGEVAAVLRRAGPGRRPVLRRTDARPRCPAGTPAEPEPAVRRAGPHRHLHGCGGHATRAGSQPWGPVTGRGLPCAPGRGPGPWPTPGRGRLQARARAPTRESLPQAGPGPGACRRAWGRARGPVRPGAGSGGRRRRPGQEAVPVPVPPVAMPPDFIISAKSLVSPAGGASAVTFTP